MIGRWLIGSVAVMVLGSWVALPPAASTAGPLSKTVSTGVESLVDPGAVNPLATASGVAPTSDGGYVIAGSVTGPLVGLIARFSSSGELQWQHRYGCAGSELLSVQPTSDGGYIASGGSQGCKVDCRSGEFNDLRCGWLLKVSASGTPEWQKFFVGAFGASASQVSPTSDGGYVVAGSTSNQAGTSFGWVAKLDADGAAVWQRQIGASTLAIANTVAQTTDGGYVIGGTDRTGVRAEVVKLNGAGNVEWARQYNGGVSSEIESLAATPSDGLVAAGRYSAVINDQTRIGVLLMKLDPSGVIMWQKLYYGSGRCSPFACFTGGSYAAAVRSTADGGYAISGAVDVTLVRPHVPDIGGWQAETDSRGNIVEQNFFAQLDHATGLPYGGSFSGIAQTSDRGYVAAGSDDRYNNSNNIVIVKTNSNGDIPGCSLLSPALLVSVNAGLSPVPTSDPGTTVINPGRATSSASPPGGLILHEDC